MVVFVPGGLIAIFIAFYISYSHNRRVRLRHEERKEELDNRREELLNYLNKVKHKKVKEK